MENVWKFFEESPVVKDLTLDIRGGEFLVFVGPSGCGKTTSLRMLAGLERPSHGRIFMNDRDVTDIAPGERDIAMVFQSYALYPNMSVYKNLAFGPRVRHDPKAGLDQRINEVAELLGIKHLLQRSPSALSGGQRQRVALGRALIREPHIFLMDEPLSNLDAALRVQMRAELIRLHRRLEATTTVYVTHDQVEALTMGDRVAVMRDGVLLQVDSPNDIFEHPATSFVGEFIGSPKMNMLTGVLRRSSEGASVEVLGATIQLTADQVARLAETSSESTVKVGIRPHDLVGVSDAEPDSLAGVVELVEHMGTEFFANVEIAGARLNVRLPRTTRPHEGESLHLKVPAERLYLFDAQDDRNLLRRAIEDARG
jgi:multiple sugar transport system ATP-binding protein